MAVAALAAYRHGLPFAGAPTTVSQPESYATPVGGALYALWVLALYALWVRLRTNPLISFKLAP